MPVGIWEGEPVGAPHFGQKLLSAGTSLEHDGHFISLPIFSIAEDLVVAEHRSDHGGPCFAS
jgi:hypothetical protein